MESVGLLEVLKHSSNLNYLAVLHLLWLSLSVTQWCLFFNKQKTSQTFRYHYFIHHCLNDVLTVYPLRCLLFDHSCS